MIKTINSDEIGEYNKDFMRIKFESDDNLSLGRTIKPRMLTENVRSVFEEDGKHYIQVFLDECLYELQKCNTIQSK